ncbi:MAG: bifunctional YncE family protein/alkaline phosphatase family protein [Bryobacteraceae bacterium]
MRSSRTWLVAAVLVVVLSAVAAIVYPRLGRQADGSFLIPTGQRLTPAGRHFEVNDRPLGMVLSPDGKRIAVVTGSNFAPRALHILDTEDGKLLDKVPLDSFVGVAFSKDGQTLYVGGGVANAVKVLRQKPDGGFKEEDSFPFPGGAPSGLSLSPDGTKLYVALNLKHAAAVIDLAGHAVTEISVGMYPYTTVAAPSGKKFYVSNWGGRHGNDRDLIDERYKVVVDPRTGIPSSGTLSVIDTETKAVIKDIDVGLHPSAMALSPKGDRLYVANANSDTVSVIDTASDAVLYSIDVRPGDKAPIGSAPNALAVSADGKTLYVANGANNAIAIVDIERPGRIRGLVPTGWYPAAVATAAGGKKLWVASGYGFGSVAEQAANRKGRSYRDRLGVVSLIDLPEGRQLREATAQVMANNKLVGSGEKVASNHPVPIDRAHPSPIRHVFYIIKENRTYDQLLGDMTQGNGDPALVQFGREVTPNHHALAESFVLLDNFYTPADQSALGHKWCTQGYASDWAMKYGNGRNDGNPMLSAPSDALWDNAKAHGVSVRAYGERGSYTLTPPTATFTDIYNGWKSGNMSVSIKPRTTVAGLKDIYHPEYPGFGGIIPDQYRADVFLKDFRQFEQNGNLPQLSILLLSNDHTSGTSPGLPTPRSAVADNDLALGRIVEAISKSKYWKESAIFVVEDDAQNGVDHVAGHRTVAFLISPWVRRKAVDSHFYTTVNMYRTMEQILGLPPQNQFDLAAEPMFPAFAEKADTSPYEALANKIPLDELSPPLRALKGQALKDAVASMKMDFSEPDEAPEEILNRIIWRSAMGAARAYPTRGR